MSRETQKIISLNVFERIAFSDLNTIKKAQAFLQRHGVPRAANQKELAVKLAEVVEHLGDAVATELLKIHPDAHHFTTDSFLADCGCARLGANGEGQEEEEQPAEQAAAAPEQPAPKKSGTEAIAHIQIKEYIPVIVVAGLFCLTMAAITSK